MLNLHTAINTIGCRPVRDIGPVKAVWCSAQCSGGGCPDETWLLAVLSWTKQHLQQPITESCTVPRRSKPQGQGMPAKLLFHAYLHKCNRCTWMFYFWGEYCCVFFGNMFMTAPDIFAFSQVTVSSSHTGGGKSTPPSSATLIYGCTGK